MIKSDGIITVYFVVIAVFPSAIPAKAGIQ